MCTCMFTNSDREKRMSCTYMSVRMPGPPLTQVQCCLLVGCLTSHQHAIESPGQICSDKFTYCHTEIEVADQTFYLTRSQYTYTGLTSPRADPIMPGTWQRSHWSANFEIGKLPSQAGFELRIFRFQGGHLNH